MALSAGGDEVNSKISYVVKSLSFSGGLQVYRFKDFFIDEALAFVERLEAQESTKVAFIDFEKSEVTK